MNLSNHSYFIFGRQYSVRAFLRLTLLAFVGSLMSSHVNGQLPRRIPSPNQDTATLIQTIETTRSAYEIELLAVSTYEAALKTTYLKDDTRTRAEQFYADHKRHAETLLNMLDSLGGKSDDIKSIKKNYGGLESEREVIDHLIRCEENSEKELSTD